MPFVGIKAYEQAGGAVERDLFQEKVYFSDTELVERLALEKLSRTARKLEKGCEWAWVVHGLDRESPDHWSDTIASRADRCPP